MADAGPVRAANQLEWAHLASYLREQWPAAPLPAGSMEVGQFPGGRSNLTYLLRFGSTEIVLRRPPLGTIAATAHDMVREYRWLSALHPMFPLAPKPYLLCEDPSIVGSPFFLMERRHGLIVRDEEPPQLRDQPGMRRRVGEMLVDTLADLHAIDIARHGLGNLGKPAGFVERQVRGWTERWQRAKTAPVSDMDMLARWLHDRLPAEPAIPSIVHGDFKLDNVMLDATDPGRAAGVFDWEMSALGDPLIDLGILLTYWGATGPDHASQHAFLSQPGWLKPDEIVARYAARSGRDVSAIRFYEVFGLFKVAVVVQQLFRRHITGEIDDARFAAFDARAAYLANRAATRALQ